MVQPPDRITRGRDPIVFVIVRDCPGFRPENAVWISDPGGIWASFAWALADETNRLAPSVSE